MKSLRHKLIYVASFSGLFLGFLIITFPFGLLKEALIVPLSQTIGQPIAIEKMSISLPPRINFTTVTLSPSDNTQDLNIHKLQVGIKLSRLLMGKLHLWSRIFYDPESRRTQQGVLTIEAQLPLSALNSTAPIPTMMMLQAQQFPLTELLRYGIQTYTNSPSVNLLVAPLLEQLSFKGLLQSDIKLTIAAGQLNSLDGKINLTLENFQFASTDPNLVIPEQTFELAQINTQIQNGQITIDPSSAFQSEDIGVGLAGTIQLAEPIRRATTDMKIDLNMGGAVLEQLGVVVQMALLRQQQAWNGQLTLSLLGPLLAPQIHTSQPTAPPQ